MCPALRETLGADVELYVERVLNRPTDAFNGGGEGPGGDAPAPRADSAGPRTSTNGRSYSRAAAGSVRRSSVNTRGGGRLVTP